jgi:hypothetical protein
MRYVQRQDGEGFAVPSGVIYRIACCDCGLVHDFVFVSQDGNVIGIAARRNERSTAAKRNAMSKMKKIRARRVRHQANQACKFGKSAKPTHKRLGGRSGHGMRKDGKSVRS